MTIAETERVRVASLTAAAIDHLTGALRDLDRAWTRLEDAGWAQEGYQLHQLADQVATFASRSRSMLRSVRP